MRLGLLNKIKSETVLDRSVANKKDVQNDKYLNGAPVLTKLLFEIQASLYEISNNAAEEDRSQH